LTPGSFTRRAWLSGTLGVAALLAGCASQTSALSRGLAGPGLPRRAELADVPFFPRSGPDLCGPESLATLLQAQGFAVTPAELVPQVYLPGRRGSLQIEMLAAARRAGALAVQLPRTLAALCTEIAGGHAVLVLQNLGLSVAPAWHYAVAVGYDLDLSEVLLRSGDTARQRLSMRTFERTWARGHHWAIVALAPGRLPHTATEDEVVRALVAFERQAEPAAAVRAYEAARARWGHNLTITLGHGNSLYRAGRPAQAADAFETAARQHGHAAAWINLGMVALELGQRDRARAAAQQALALGGPWAAQARVLAERVESHP
jgi:tetratricopeptide (TPR) repeat protein